VAPLFSSVHLWSFKFRTSRGSFREADRVILGRPETRTTGNHVGKPAEPPFDVGQNLARVWLSPPFLQSRDTMSQNSLRHILPRGIAVGARRSHLGTPVRDLLALASG
jgi:hypothetical protein